MANLLDRVRSFWFQARRVVLVSTKPDPDEFKVSMKITGLGITLIGIIGFAIFMIFAVIGPMVGGI